MNKYADVKVQWRRNYGDTWKTVIGPHPTGMALVAKVRDLHKENPLHHFAVFIDGSLNFAWTPNTGMGDQLEVTINGVKYEPSAYEE